MRKWIGIGCCALAIAVAALALGRSKTADAQNVTPQTLARALSAMRSGGRLSLAPGHYGPLHIERLQPAKLLTIESAVPDRPAIFSTIDIVESANIRLARLKVAFSPAAATTTSDNAVRIYRSSRIAVQSLKIVGGMAINGVPASTPEGQLDRTMNILGQPTARGITVHKSSDVTIDQNEITSFFRGIVLIDSSKIRITGNYVHFLRTSPLVGSKVSDVLIEGNIFSESHPWRFGGRGDHGDLVHIWNDDPGKMPITGLVIRSNWLRQGAGQALLGIFLEDNGGGGFRDVVIENNLIHNGNRQGMRLEGVSGRIARNTLVQTPGDQPKSAPGILVTNGSNVTVEANVTGSIDHNYGGTSIDRDNLIVQRFAAGRPGYYADVFRNALGSGDDPADFALSGAHRPVAGFDLDTIRAVLTRRR